MSRCFPYPPPGYVRKVARTEAALIESIKLQSERRQHKTDSKKEKSKHKKEKSKDKKHKSKERKEKSSRSRDLNDQKQKACIKEAKDRLEGTKVEAEQLEKSGLTEEHGQPVWPHSPGYLSDGTQINHKRKRDDSLQPDEGCKPGKVIRIKLASSLSQQENSSAGSEQTCSVSGRDSSRDQKSDENSCGPVRGTTCFANSEMAVAVKDRTSSKPKIKDPPPHAVKDRTSSKPKIEDPPPHVVKDRTSSKPKIKDAPSHAVKEISSLGNVMSLPRTRSPVESAYEALFEKWVPPPLQLEQQMDDEEWLFRTEKQDGRSTKTNEASFSSVPSCRSSSLWPRGQYLADADVYSLPYTIPY